MAARDHTRITQQFLADLQDPESLLMLLDYIPRVYFFVKDTRGRFMKVNEGWLRLHGHDHERDALGKTDFDYHPPTLAAQYVDEDKRVMASGQPLVDQMWLVMGYDKMPRWYLCTKMPIYRKDGKISGVAGIMRPHDQAGATSPGDYHRLTPVIEHVTCHYGSQITVEDLAACAHLSVSQLQREFQRLFSMTPTLYITRVRLLMARRLLEEGGAALGQIALDCGFYDQSHFTRTFRSMVGQTPSYYRKRFGRK
jgi:AraC-like DNA-binding protein